MVLKIFYNGNIYVYQDIDKTFCHTLSYGGMHSLQFDVPTNHSLYKYFQEEVRVEYDDQYYLIKGVNERTSAGICTINAELDLTGLESKVYLSKKWSTVSFDSFTTDILSGTGWSISNADLISKRTSVEAADNTPLELLEQSTNKTSFAACYEYDTKNKVITCIKPENNTTPTGCYFTDELNLTDLSFKGSSTSLVTKLYPVGKDGLTIASVNNGKDYIENYTYTDKVKVKVWRDERYTNAQTLKEDAIVKLEAMAKPERSYTCKIIDLAKTNPDKYSAILSFSLYDVSTLIDRNRETRIDHRIVEIKEYPADHSLDTVTFSTIAGRITGKYSKIDNRITELDAQQLHNRTKVNEIKQDLDTTVLKVSESWAESENRSMITQTAEGLFLEITKIIGSEQWGTKLQQSSEDVQIAWNNISKYIQFKNGEFRIYDSNVEASQKLRSVFSESGSHFYRDGYYVGKIGTNEWVQNEKHKGLVFDLEPQAKYMAFAQRESEDDDQYTVMLSFERANTIHSGYGLHLGCDMDAHGRTIKNVYLSGVSVKDGNTNKSGYNGDIPIVTGIKAPSISVNITNVRRNSDGAITDFEISANVSVDYTSTRIRVVDGIVVGYGT